MTHPVLFCILRPPAPSLCLPPNPDGRRGAVRGERPLFLCLHLPPVYSSQPEFVNVCFWFVPPSLRGKKESPDYSKRLSKVAPILKERMVRKGSMMIGYQPHGTRSNFFRMVVANPALTRADMDFLLNELERLGQDLGVAPSRCWPGPLPPPSPSP